MQLAKKHIRTIVEQYIKLYPQEFADFKDAMKMIRASLKDEEFGQAMVGTSSQTRALYELPENLHQMFVMNLEEEDMVWLKAGGVNRKEGGLWFAKTFKDFAIPTKI